MESSEREPSYYEVALTHRQVMIGLVVALTTVVVAFFAGIWIGRDNAGSPSAAATQAAASAEAPPGAEKLTFFGDKPADTIARPKARPAPIAPAPVAEPDVDAPTPADGESAKLRQTLEAEMAANRVAGEPAADNAAPAPDEIAPGTRVARGNSAQPAPPPAAPDAGGTLWIQVYSSSNGERAREISAKLQRGGFAVRTLEPGSASGANYRVRVGPYADRPRAERVATRLRREFRLDTWITDAP